MLIDNIIVSADIYSSYCSGILLEDLSDHFPCVLTVNNLQVRNCGPTVINSRKLTPKNLEQIKTEVEKLDLCNFDPMLNVNRAFQKLHDSILLVVNRIAPFESFIPGKYSYCIDLWLPFNLLKGIKKQRKLYRKTLSKDCKQKDR